MIRQRLNRVRNDWHAGGFTLVELLVVITVLAILIGLLIPAVNNVRSRVRITQVQAEINRLASSVTSFKSTYGSEPPSSIRLCENAALWTNYPRDRALIRQLWPQFDFTVNRDLDGDGDSDGWDQDKDGTGDNLPFILEPGECLVFFLGGLPVKDTSSGQTQWSLLGFTKNPQNPFSRANNANRDSSTYDFEASRLVDLDQDGFPEFLDSFPGQTSPLLYYSSYDGNGYRVTDGNEFPASAGVNALKHPYLQGGNENSQPFSPKSFQIISPGADGRFGVGGPYQPGDGVRLPGWTRTSPALTVTPADRSAERDNITNFGNGLLDP